MVGIRKTLFDLIYRSVIIPKLRQLQYRWSEPFCLSCEERHVSRNGGHREVFHIMAFSTYHALKRSTFFRKVR